MLTPSIFLPLLPSLGHLPRHERVCLLEALCLAIRDDRRARGDDPQLMLLGATLDYCASLLRDAGDDEPGDGADAALVQLEHELAALLLSLRAALRRPGEAGSQAAAARLLERLFPAGEWPDSLTAARGLVRLGSVPAVRADLNRLGLRLQLHHVEEALGEVDRSLDRCRIGSTSLSAVRLHARSATRMAEVLLRRLVGHVTAVTDPADDDQRARARALLAPLAAVAASADLAEAPAHGTA